MSSEPERILRIGYIREHFSSPLLQLADEDNGKTFTLVECPSGTGQIISRFINDEIDVAIGLTDGLVVGIAMGTSKDTYKLVGSYVVTPLKWAVVTGQNSKYQNIADLRGTTLGISRIGSGSHIMANVLGLQNGWTDPVIGIVDKIEFQVNNDINGLNASVNDGSTSAYLWDWFTTKPWVDRGEGRFIGSVETPWPAWTIAAHRSPERAPPASVISFLERLTTFVQAFDSAENRTSADVEFVKERFGYPEEDVKAWLETVKWTPDAREVKETVLRTTISKLARAGVLSPACSLRASDYVDEDVAKLILSPTGMSRRA